MFYSLLGNTSLCNLSCFVVRQQGTWHIVSEQYHVNKVMQCHFKARPHKPLILVHQFPLHQLVSGRKKERSPVPPMASVPQSYVCNGTILAVILILEDSFLRAVLSWWEESISRTCGTLPVLSVSAMAAEEMKLCVNSLP